MKSTMVQPTQEELIQYFLDDSIGRNNDTFDLLTLLSSIDGYYSIALDGCWGSGKTVFVKQAKLIINAINEFAVDEIEEIDRDIIKAEVQKRSFDYDALTQISAVYYDAWANDNDIDPIVSMLLSIASTTNNKANKQKERDTLDIIAKTADVITGRNVSELVKALRGEKKIDASKDITDKMQASILELLENILVEHAERLVLFIDELDRCRPSYAMKLLEQIEHYFHSDRITFVFSTNIEQLQHTVKNYYGEAFDGARYLNRFFDMVVLMPDVNIEKCFKNMGFKQTNFRMDIICEMMLRARMPSLRDKAKFVQSVSRIYNWESKQQWEVASQDLLMEGVAYHFAVLMVIPIIIGLRIVSTEAADKFINGEDYPTFLEFFGDMETLGYYAKNLLSNTETYDADVAKEHTGQVLLTTYENKLEALYKALFVTKYDDGHPRSMIGAFKIDNELRSFILEKSNPIHTLYKSGGRQ